VPSVAVVSAGTTTGSTMAPMPAAAMGYDERLPGVGECRKAIDEALRALGRTSTIWPRDAMNPLECARTRYGPGGNRRSSKRPARSVTATADELPNADTIAPATGAPFSS